MANSTPYAVFLDIDGTILNPLCPDSISPVTRRVLSDMRRHGHLFFVNTGRAPGFIPYSAVPREDFDGFCAGLGAYAEMHGKALYAKTLSDATVRDIVAYCDARNETCFFEGGIDDLDGRYSFHSKGSFRAPRRYETPAEFFEAASGRTFYKITIPYIPNAEFRAFLERYFDMTYCTEVKDSSVGEQPAYAEGALIGCDKGYAVRRVCALLNIPVERSIAIGDSENDLGMLRAAGISVAMGSAPDEVKKQCDHVTDTVANDGAARAIVSLLGGDGKEYF